MTAHGEEYPAELYETNLTNWRIPQPESTYTASDSTAGNDEIGLVSGDKGGEVDENKKVFTKGRLACLACVLVCLLALGLGLGLGLSNNNRSASNISSNIQQCGNNGKPCCNGLETNCNLRVNEMVFAATHNSMSSSADGFTAANHFLSMEDSLKVGYRALFLDLCSCRDGLLFCHGACKAGTRDPKKVFEAIADFLRANPTEVLLVELQVGEPNELLWDLYDVITGIDGLVDQTYAHPDRSTPWPLMGELVENDTRLIMFQHDGPNCFRGECPPVIHNTYGYMFETSFDLRGVDEVLDYDKSCKVTRGDAKNDFFILNHFSNNRFGLPSAQFSRQLNEQSFVEERTAACTERVGKFPNLISVDFWSEGDVPRVAQLQNAELGATSPPSFAPSASPAPSASATSMQPSVMASESPSTSTTSISPTAVAITDTVAPSIATTVSPTSVIGSSSPSAAGTTVSSTFPTTTIGVSSSPSLSTVSASPSAGQSPVPSSIVETVSPTVLSAPIVTPSPSVSTLSPTALVETQFPTVFLGGEPIVELETWFQCSGDSICRNGFDETNDCFGDNENCPEGETCTVACSFYGTQYCYYRDVDDCTLPTLQCGIGGVDCPNGGECVEWISFECGTRVCKDTTIGIDIEACQPDTVCKNDSDCPGDEQICVSYNQDCGFAV